MSEQFVINGHQKTTSTKTANNGISQLSSHFLNRQNQGVQQTSGAMPHYGGGAEKCARCSKNVYLAEKKLGAGRSYHSSCFSCESCNRKLDATTLSEHKGEIYCKTCYTRQFGVHGLVSGVTMSTEHPVNEVRHSRRSSYGSDLDAPVMTHKQNRQRAHSNDNSLRGEHSAIQSDELPKMFPWRNDVLPEQPLLPAGKLTATLDEIANRPYPRPESQLGFGKVIQSTTDEIPSRQSVYSGEEDRQKYIFEGEKTPYGHGASALLNMPMPSPPKRSDSTIEHVEIPLAPNKHTARSRSPSPTSTDTYRRQESRQHHTDISDNFSRLTLNEKQHEMKQNNVGASKITTENPLLKQTYSHSTSHEDKHITANVNRERSQSRDSSPSAMANNNRSPSPTSGYGSSSAHGDGALRDSTSPPSAYVPQHDYLNARSSNANVVGRQPLSPSSSHNERTSSAVGEFASKTNIIGSPVTSGKYSTIGALIKPHRPSSQVNNDDDFDN